MDGKPALMRKAMGLVIEDPPVCRLCSLLDTTGVTVEVPDLPGEKLLVEIGRMKDGAVEVNVAIWLMDPGGG